MTAFDLRRRSVAPAGVSARKVATPVTTKALEYNATIIHKELLTPTLAIFRVRHDDPIATFIPGQYAIIGLNHPEKGGVMRPYSIASAPYLHGEYLEFYIRYVSQPTSDNPLTHLLFKVEEGDRLMMRPKIQGHFTEEKCMGKEDRRLRILVAAGTGLAPFTSMVFEHHHQTGDPGPYAIVHGASYPVDLGYREELEALLNKPGAAPRYAATISRPWRRRTGPASWAERRGTSNPIASASSRSSSNSAKAGSIHRIARS